MGAVSAGSEALLTQAYSCLSPFATRPGVATNRADEAFFCRAVFMKIVGGAMPREDFAPMLLGSGRAGRSYIFENFCIINYYYLLH